MLLIPYTLQPLQFPHDRDCWPGVAVTRLHTAQVFKVIDSANGVAIHTFLSCSTVWPGAEILNFCFGHC